MKKSLVFLLILAVAGGIFAQEGSFSWSGGVDINAKVQFAEAVTPDPILQAIDDALIKGHADLAYTLGNLTLGLGFSATYWDDDDGDLFWWNNGAAGISASVNYETDRFGLHAEMDIIGSGGIAAEPTSLWGYYNFFDGALRFDVAYRGGGNGVWAVSDLVKDDFWDGWNWLDDAAGVQFTFLGVENLSAGIIFPWDGFKENLLQNSRIDFVEDVLKDTLFGVSYSTDAFGASLMLALNHVGRVDPTDVSLNLHVGFFYNISDAMKVAFDVSGLFADDTGVSAGLDFGYNGGALSAGIMLGFFDFTDSGLSGEQGGSYLKVAPRVSYQINDPIKVGLDLTFGVGLGDAATKDLMFIEIAPYVSWAIDGASFKVGYCLNFDLDASDIADHNVNFSFSWSF